MIAEDPPVIVETGPGREVTVFVSDYDFTVQALGVVLDSVKASATESKDPDVWRFLLALAGLEYALNPDDDGN